MGDGGIWGLNIVSNLCICGDFVAGVTRASFISVWNWKTGQLVFEKVRISTNLKPIQSNKHPHKYTSQVHFSSFDFLDEHHILYGVSDSDEDSIYVYDLHRGQQQQKQPQKEEEEEIGLLRFHLALPSINRGTTSRYIQLRRNALPTATGPLLDWRNFLDDAGIAPGPGPATAPFHADPHERLIVARIVTSPVGWGEEQFELHVPARAFLEHFSSSTVTANTGETRQRDDNGGRKDKKDSGVVVPWSAWRNSTRVTPPRELPYTIQARMIVYGMRAVLYPPDRDEGMLHVDSYLRRREGGKEAGTATSEEAEPAPASLYGTRQAIRLPVEIMSDCLLALCEDALLCYKVNYRTQTGLSLLQYRMPDGLCHRLIHCRAKSRMRIGTPFKMGNEWAVIIRGPFAARSFVHCYYTLLQNISCCTHHVLRIQFQISRVMLSLLGAGKTYLLIGLYSVIL